MNAVSPHTIDGARSPRGSIAWAPPLVAALAVLALSVPPLLFDGYYFGFDTSHIDLGMGCQLQDLMRHGRPLWLSPWLGNGGQLFGNPGAQLLYPPRLLLLALPVDLGISLFLVMHLALAAAGCTALVRTFRVRPLVAICAGIVFASSGTAVDLIQHSYYLPPVAWLPWTWAACRRSFAPRSWRRWPPVVGLGIALCLLGGEPQGAGIALSLVVAEVLWRAWRAWRVRGTARPVLPRGGAVLGSALAGLCVGLVPWPSYFAEAALGTRRGVLGLQEVLSWSFGPPEWAAALLPGRLFSSAAWQALVGADEQRLTTWNPSPYLGGSLLLLAAFGSLQRRARLPALLAGFFLVAALGIFTPFYPVVVAALPPLALFRYPQKYLLVMTLAVVIVAALQVEHLDRRRAARRLFVVGALPLLASLGVALAGLARPPAALQTTWRPWQQELSVFAHLDVVALMRGSVLHAGALLALSVVVVLLARRPTRWIAALLAVDVVLAAVGTVKVGPALADLHAPLYHLPSASPRVLCEHPAYHGMSFPTAEAADAPWAQEALLRLYDVPERQACDGISSAVPYAPGVSRVAVATALQTADLSPARARALGCTHLLHIDENLREGVERERFEDLPSERARRFAQGGPPLYRIVDPIPEHFVSRRPELALDESTVVLRMSQALSATRALAIVDDPLRRVPPSTVLPDGEGVSIARVHWPVRSEATLEMTGRGGAVVGLRTAFLVGWQAEQAGRALPVLRVSGSQLGVLVDDAARGPVHLHYRSPHLAPAIALAIAGALVLLIVPWLPRARPRSSPAVSAGSGSAGSPGPAS